MSCERGEVMGGYLLLMAILYILMQVPVLIDAHLSPGDFKTNMKYGQIIAVMTSIITVSAVLMFR